MPLNYDHNYYINNREKYIERSKRWALENPERCKELHHNRYIKNKERHIIQARQWAKINPKLFWASVRLCQHKQRGCVCEITTQELYEFIKDKDCCYICGKELSFQPYMDNKESVWKVSRDLDPSLDRLNNEKIIRKDNIQLLCRKCNATKSNRTMQEFVDYCRMVSEKFSNIKGE